MLYGGVREGLPGKAAKKGGSKKNMGQGRSNKTGRCRGNGSFVSADPAYFLRGGIWMSSAS